MLALENDDKEAGEIRRLIDAHQGKVLEVALLATSASENMRGSRGFPGSFALFEERVAALGLEGLPIVRMPGVWGLTFWGHSYWVDTDRYKRLSECLWGTIAPKLKNFIDEWKSEKGREPTEEEFQGREFSKYRNAWCDVHSAYCHIEEKRDYFVTSNTKDFPPNGQPLATLGLLALTPLMAAERLL